MNSQNLFIELITRLKKYDDAAVLMILLAEHADVKEEKVTAGKLSLDRFQESIDRKNVQRAFARLSAAGLISIRIHANTRTHVTVHRDAVLALLREPLAPRLPGMVAREFPFLDVWRESLSAPELSAVSITADAAAVVD